MQLPNHAPIFAAVASALVVGVPAAAAPTAISIAAVLAR